MKNTGIKEMYVDARINLAVAKQAYNQAKTALTKSLVERLPSDGDGLTAAEIAKINDLDSHTVADLLCSNGNAHGSKRVVNKYAFVNDDGTVDMERVVTRKYIVNTYRK